MEQVASLRAQLWDAGFRPVAVLNHDHPDPKVAGKAPIGKNWGDLARQDPPDCITRPPVAHALNTGILTDGLRAIDIDVDDPEIAARCRSLVVQAFGEAPIRMRRNSSRCLILYRAATGAPSKVVVAGTRGKVEVLGKGQQFVAFGRHPTGADLEWFPDAPGEETADALPAIAEDALFDVLDQLAPLIDGEPPRRTNGHDHAPGEPQADPLRIAAALNTIANTGPPDWEAWNRIGMAIWRATGGSEMGRDAWHAWSSRNSAYDPSETQRRWDHYFTSPPTEIGAGTLFHMARGQQQDVRPTEKPEPADNNAPLQSPFPLLWFRSVEPALDVRDFVQGLLVEGSSAVVYGRSNSGKTFWTTDLALHVAAGLPWRNRRVEQSGVVYCVLEGGMGFLNRVSAWKEDRGYGSYDLPFAAIQSSIRLLDPAAQTSDLILAIRAAAQQIQVPVRLVVIDTLARAIAGGNENAPEDMGALVAAMDLIRAETGAAVLFVHHSGKDEAKGARGHSSLQAAIDTEIEVIDTEVGDPSTRCATVVKQRELRKGDTFEFTLRTVEIGQNRHGEPVTTCVVEDGGEAAGVRRHAPGGASALRHLKGHNRRALEVLTDLLAVSGKAGFAGTPADLISVPEDWWREQFYERAMAGADQGTKKRTFRRAADHLVEIHLVGLNSGRVWLVRGERDKTGQNEGT